MGGRLQRIKVWRKGQEVPRAWGFGRSAWNHEALISSWGGAGAKAARIPLRRVGAFSESLPIPADASSAYRPNPQATTELAPGPPVTEGLHAKMDFEISGWRLFGLPEPLIIGFHLGFRSFAWPFLDERRKDDEGDSSS
jgi:hypothetical protein